MWLFPSFGTMLRLIVGSVAVGFVSAAGLLYTYQRSIIYPSAFPEDSRSVVDTPDMYELPYKEEFLETPDHEKLQTFVMLQQDASGDTSTARERPTLVMLHANAGNMVRLGGLPNGLLTLHRATDFLWQSCSTGASGAMW